MFKVLLYFDTYEKRLDTVTNMKKLGIDVDSHQQPLQAISQAIEFNADFVVLQSLPDIETACGLANKLSHLSKAPIVILLKKESQKIDPAEIMKNNIAKVFSESFEIHDLLSYLLEAKGFDPHEVLNKYLQAEAPVVKKKLHLSQLKIDEKFKQRDYSESLSDFDPAGGEASLDGQKVLAVKKKLAAQKLDMQENDRDLFLQALLAK